MKLQRAYINCKLIDLGLIEYSKGYNLQKDILNKVILEKQPSTLIICEHTPTITLGRLANRNNILLDEKEVSTKGINVFKVERGGDVTYHGPGQLVIYPIFNLNFWNKDLSKFLRTLEQIIIEFLDHFHIKGYRKIGFTGVWVDDCKIASIGIAVKKWVTFHGLAININTNLDSFSLIRPCGLDIKMTSLARLKEVNFIDMSLAKQVLAKNFRKIFGLEIYEEEKEW